MLKQIVSHTYRPLLKRYLSSPRRYTYEDISIVVEPGVFHPAFFFSTKLLLEHLKDCDLQGKTLLELGAGSGLISVYAAKRGAMVSASDISNKAIENVQRNAELNKVDVDIYHSDLFGSIQQKTFDYIIVNPPYFKKDALAEHEYAWYCGRNGEYFEKFFSQLDKYTSTDTKVLMVLSEECDIDMIKQFAQGNNVEMEVVMAKKVYWEMNYIYQLHKAPNSVNR